MIQSDGVGKASGGAARCIGAMVCKQPGCKLRWGGDLPDRQWSSWQHNLIEGGAQSIGHLVSSSCSHNKAAPMQVPSHHKRQLTSTLAPEFRGLSSPSLL